MADAATDTVSFDVSPADSRLISKIVKRATKRDPRLDGMSTRMDLTATHANGNPLRLADMLAADDFNLMHDVYGIARHLDRSNGRLTGLFSPRFSARVADAEAA
jgi:hypothetical protein